MKGWSQYGWGRPMNVQMFYGMQLGGVRRNTALFWCAVLPFKRSMW